MMVFKDRKGIVFAMYAIGANGDHELPEKFKQSKKASKVITSISALSLISALIHLCNFLFLMNNSSS